MTRMDSTYTTSTTAPASEKRSIYDRIGGKRLIGVCVEELYKRILRDEKLVPFFAGVDMARVKQHQVKFLTMVFSEKVQSNARYLESVRMIHAHMPIREIHFDKICVHLIGTLTDLGVKPELVRDIGASMEPFRDCFNGKASPKRIEKKSILERIGGKRALDLCVEEVYFKLLCDRNLVAFFEGYNLKRLKTHQKTFLLLVFSNKVDRSEAFYESFRRTHEPLGLTIQHFDMFASHLLDTFSELNVKDEIIEDIVESMQPFRECFIPRKKKPIRLMPSFRRKVVKNTISFSNRLSCRSIDVEAPKKTSPLWRFLSGKTRGGFHS